MNVASAGPVGAGHLDERLMRLAVALGRRHLGLTWPNPSVGAVLVQMRDGAPVIVGQGATAPGGRPHAEPAAIAAAGGDARGGTLYVSLEPCSHHGRTPPCADAIVAAGLARVVSAIEDPDSRVTGRGHAILRAAGLAVEVGAGAAAAAEVHRGHVSRVRSGRPFVCLKLARTPDGFAGGAGERLLITGPGANARTHLLRAQADAILVGIATIVADDPRLDVRLPGLETRRPVRLVADTRLRLPETCRLVATARRQPVWVLAGEDAPLDRERRLRDAGVEIVRVTLGPDGRLDLAAALRALGARGLTRVFCEGGPALADGLAAAGLADQIVLMTGAVPLGAGQRGRAALSPALAACLQAEFARVSVEPAAPDTIETFERITSCSRVS